jgi:putative SOS response-associated peptidase YedK
MCFSLSIVQSPAKLQAHLKASPKDTLSVGWKSVYYLSGWTFPELPILTTLSAGEWVSAKWGLIPAWASSVEQARECQAYTLNARGETLAEKPSFRDSVENRAVVPVTGFFEWQHLTAKDRQPYFISGVSDEMWALAALFQFWRDPQTGTGRQTFTLITTAANPLMARIHNSRQRMPWILPGPLLDDWLNPAYKTSELLISENRLAEKEMQAWPVTPLLGRKEYEGNQPRSLEPISQALQGNLFG